MDGLRAGMTMFGPSPDSPLGGKRRVFGHVDGHLEDNVHNKFASMVGPMKDQTDKSQFGTSLMRGE